MKKASFRSRTVKREIVRGMLERRVHGLNHRVDWDDHLINEAKVLNLIGKHQGVRTGRMGCCKPSQ